MLFVTELDLRIKFWRQSKKLPLSFNETLSHYTNLDIPGDEKIIFSWLTGHNTKNLNASAARKGRILVNLSWAMRILEYDNEDTLNAFKATIGHELTHKDNDLKISSFSEFTELRFLSWVNEVHADFSSKIGFQNNLV